MSRGHVPDTSLQAALDEMAAFTAGVEQRLNSCLRAGTIPDADLVDAIAVANQSPRLPESIRDCPSLPEIPRRQRASARSGPSCAHPSCSCSSRILGRLAKVREMS